MEKQSNAALWVGILIAIVIAIGGYFFPQQIKQEAGAIVGSITNGTNFKYGISVGSVPTLGVAPTNFAKILAGNGVLIMSSFTVAASSSVAADIAVTGAISTDLVFSQFATSSANGAGWLVTQASASSTPGFVTLRIVNNTGASAVLPSSLGSSTPYLILGTQ